MTIKPGEAWGRQVARPEGLVTVTSDRELVSMLARSGDRPIAVGAGDLARTLGVASGNERTFVNELPIDLLEVRLDGASDVIVACAHVVARSDWKRGRYLSGPILAVMNAEFIGEWDVAPRGHPNDGRAEVFDVDAAMSVRDRLAARRRLRNATHIPHPLITTRSIRSASWSFQRRLDVIVDGHRVGRASSLTVGVRPDAAIVYA
jgi:hypothetical protein